MVLAGTLVLVLMSPSASEVYEPASVESEEVDYEPWPPLRLNQMSSPWLSLSLTVGGTFMPMWDMSLRPRLVVGFFRDAIELGGTLIAGVNGIQGWGGAGVLLNWTPVPYRAGEMIYTHVGIGRLYTKDQFLGRRHVDYMQFALGVRIAKRPREQLLVPFVEVGVDHRRRCGDWATPCSFDDIAWWMPWIEGGVRFR